MFPLRLCRVLRAGRAKAASAASKEDQKFRDVVSQEILDMSPGVSWGSIAGKAALQGVGCEGQ